MQAYADKKRDNQSASTIASAKDEEKRDSSAFQHIDNRPEAVQMRKSQEIANNKTKKNFVRLVDNRPTLAQVGQAATGTDSAGTSQVIQGVFIQDNDTLLWTDTDTNKVYQQTSTISGGRVSLTAQDGESLVIELGHDGAWNRVDQQAHVTLTPQRGSAYRVHADFKDFSTVDALLKQGELKKDDLPYSAHGKIRDQEFRDFFSDIPTLPAEEQPSEGYRKILEERTRAYGTLAQPAPPKKGFNKRPYEPEKKYDFSLAMSPRSVGKRQPRTSAMPRVSARA